MCLGDSDTDRLARTTSHSVRDITAYGGFKTDDRNMDKTCQHNHTTGTVKSVLQLHFSFCFHGSQCYTGDTMFLHLHHAASCPHCSHLVLFELFLYRVFYSRSFSLFAHLSSHISGTMSISLIRRGGEEGRETLVFILGCLAAGRKSAWFLACWPPWAIRRERGLPRRRACGVFSLEVAFKI